MKWLRKLWPVWVGPICLIGPALISGRVLFWGTPALQFVAWWWQCWQSISQGQWPLWNALSGMGAPLLANYQTAFFYPPNWLLLPLAWLFGPGGIAWGYTFLALLHLIWAGLGMSRLLERLGFGWLPQVLGGLSFGLTGYVIGRLGFFSMVWVAAWLPWVLFFASDLAHPGSGRQTARQVGYWTLPGLAAAVAMQLLAGHAQLAWYSLLIAGAWVLWGAWEAGGLFLAIKRIAALAGAVMLAVVTAAVQLIPTFVYLQNSQRAAEYGAEEALRYSFWPWRVLTLFSPDFFGNPGLGDYWGFATYWEDHAYPGLVIVLLALASLVILVKGLRLARRSHRWSLVFFGWLVMLVTIILALGNHTPVFPFLYAHVPTFDMFQAPARYLIWAALMLPILAAAASEHWRSPTGRGLYWFRLGTAGAFAITLGAVIAWLMLRDVRLTFVRAAAMTGILGLGVGLFTLAIPYAAKRGWMVIWNWAVIGWLGVDLLLAGWWLNPWVSINFYQQTSETTQPTVGDGRLYLDPQVEYDLKFRRFLRFSDFQPLEAWQNQRLVYLPNLNLLDGLPSANNFDPLVPGRYSRWMGRLALVQPQERLVWLDLMNVTQVEQIDLSQPGGVRFVPTGVDGGLLRWYDCAIVSDNDQQAWEKTTDMLAGSDAAIQMKRSLIVEAIATQAEPGQYLCDEGGSGTFHEVQRKYGQITFTVQADAAGWVMVSESYDQGWVAQVDGKQADIVPAYSMFMAIPAAPGTHQIVLTYRPFGFYYGALFSILGLLYLIITTMRRYGKYKQEKSM